MLRVVNIGRYQVSLLLLVLTVIGPIIVVASTYLWATRTLTFVVEEPLSITAFPSVFNVRPGENKTLDIEITNSANITYVVTLDFALNDTTYQTQYVIFSNNTYNILAGINHIQAWCQVAKKAPPNSISLAVEFYRE